jgi:hypothetical protein
MNTHGQSTPLLVAISLASIIVMELLGSPAHGFGFSRHRFGGFGGGGLGAYGGGYGGPGAGYGGVGGGGINGYGGGYQFGGDGFAGGDTGSRAWAQGYHPPNGPSSYGSSFSTTTPGQIGTTVPVLPSGATATQVNGTDYYYSNGSYYKPVFNGSQVVYAVSASPPP